MFFLFPSKQDIWCIHNKFPDFLYRHLKLSDSWKFSMLLLYILWNDWPIFMISRSNEQLWQQLEYTLLKPDCHSWWISKMQSGREDTLEQRYAIKFCYGCRYEIIEEMKEAVTKVIDTLIQEDFHGAFQKLLERYNKCIAAEGDHFEGD